MVGPPYLRAAVSTERLLLSFVFASIPVWLVGLWNLGYQALQVLATTEGAALSGWQGTFYDAMFAAPDSTASVSVIACFVLGLLYHLPLLVVALVVTALWELLFARVRGRGIDPAWLMTAWLFVLLLPPAVSPLLAAVAVSFGAVLGAHIFGGTGRYLLSPALLGVLFLHFSYPGFVQAALPVTGFSGTTTWATVATEGVASTVGLGTVFLGRELGAMATGSALACLAGAIYLAYVGAASWRTLAGALGGLVLGATLVNLFAGDDPAWGIPWYWHLALGNFSFAVAFLATDPSVGPLTRPARWGYGALIGLLTIVIRVVDPAHPEGTLYAIVLAGLTVPLLDYLVVRRYRMRAQPEEVK